LFLFSVLAAACAASTEAPPAAPTAVTPAPLASAPPSASSAPAVAATVAVAPSAQTAPPSPPPISEKAVADATGVEKADTRPDGVVKASFPRKAVGVAVEGWKIPPFMGVTSWAAFTPGKPGVAEAMVMGDLVLFEDEVNPVMSVLLDHRVEVTALHN